MSFYKKKVLKLLEVVIIGLPRDYLIKGNSFSSHFLKNKTKNTTVVQNILFLNTLEQKSRLRRSGIILFTASNKA